MRLPILDTAPSVHETTTEVFRGVDQHVVTDEGTFADMKNGSDRFYPALGTRAPRGTPIQTFKTPRGILYKNGLFAIDGTTASYKGKQVCTVTASDKTIVGMGAYICVFPDGKMYNTSSGAVDSLAASYTQSGTVTFAPLSEGSAFTKISASGIADIFSTGDNVKISGCTNSSYNGTKIISSSGSGYIVVTGALTSSFTQASGLKFERLVPSMDFVAERDNRLWGCSSSNHEIYCCKLGDPKNWYNYETGADMAYAVTVGSDGDFTGIAKYSSYMMFFKEACVHILRGDKPSNFSVTEKDFPGVRSGCSRSLQVINETLYYVGQDGVYAYDGAVPQKISEVITEEISGAVAGQYQGKLYLSCLLGGTQTVLVYDPRTGIWDREDDEKFRFVGHSDGMLYYIGADNALRAISGVGTEILDWCFESGDRTEQSLDQKYVKKLKLFLWLSAGTECTVFLKCDDEALWRKKGYVRSQRNRTYIFPVMPQRCGKYRIRIEGRGQMKLLAISKQIMRGSEINGGIHIGRHR